MIGAWLSLVKHISKDQDFDRQHTLWYINSPVMGIGVGAVIYLILRAGLLVAIGSCPGDHLSVDHLHAGMAGWLPAKCVHQPGQADAKSVRDRSRIEAKLPPRSRFQPKPANEEALTKRTARNNLASPARRVLG